MVGPSTRRLLASRGFMSAVGALALCAVTAAGYLVVEPPRPAHAYCALMPDAIGLYPGNHVTMRGITVGQVTGVAPQGDKVRVDFTVDTRYPVGEDAAATTVARTVVADRELAVLQEDWPTTPRDGCVTKTLTPKSISETFDALTRLAEQVVGPDGTAAPPLGRAVAGLDNATAGTGQQINDLIRRLGVALDSPDAALGHLAGVVDSLSRLSEAVAAHWGDIKSMLTRLAQVLDQVNNELFTETVVIIDGFRRVLPMINDITTMFGSAILTLLDATVPLTRFIGANIRVIGDILAMIPPLLDALRTVFDPNSGQPGVTYRPRRVALPAPDANAVCGAVNAVAPGRCTGTENGMADVDLVTLVLGTVSAR
ncbi:MlaD family protein [Nocardia sp. NPDC004068]|uniref:MlaD family protein n=1 Tax=Nocardia sp. NPDC004068 TaxID=3364303 RepID=UPI0036C6E405